MARTAPPPLRLARPGGMLHVLADALPAGWSVHPFGPDGVRADRLNGLTGETRIIVTRAEDPETRTVDWTHASISHPDGLPSYTELTMLREIVFGDGWSYQIFPPPSKHVNIHPNALHLYGRTDGLNVLPDFGWAGTI